MKTLILILFCTFLIIGCSDNTAIVTPEMKQPQKLVKSGDQWNITVSVPGESEGCDSVQVTPTEVTLYRNGSGWLSFPLEWNPVVSIK